MIPTDDLTREKNLWQIYRSSRAIPDSKFNRYSTVAVAALITADLLFAEAPAELVAAKVRLLANLGLTSAFAILGFLIAGFAIFTTVDAQLLMRMARKEHPTIKLSWFKYNFFVFMRVFIFFLVFSGACVAVILFGDARGGVAKAVRWSADPELTRLVLARVALVALGTATYFAIVQLKSFVFNVYHVVATRLRWLAENPPERADR